MINFVIFFNAGFTADTIAKKLSPADQLKLQAEIEQRKKDLAVLIAIGTYHHRKKLFGRDGRKLASRCWSILHEIYEANGDGEDNVIKDYFHCIECNEIEHSVRSEGNTNKLWRHKCVQDLEKTLSQDDEEKLKFAMAKFVYRDSKPYSVVEGVGFGELLNTAFEIGQANPKVKTEEFARKRPTRNTMKNTVHTVFNETISLIAKEISMAKNCKSINIVIDNWTDDFARNSYFGVNVLLAYTDSNGQIIRKKYTLNVDEVSEPVKTKQVLAEHLYRILLQYGLSPEEVREIVIVIADRGANMKYMLKDEKIRNVHCFAHIINNIVEHMLKVDEIRELQNAASQLTSYVKSGGMCKELNTTLKSFCRTRWNGVYIMFNAILNNYVKLVEVLSEKSALMREMGTLSNQKNPMEYINDVNIDMMAKLTPLLKKFYEITLKVEGHHKPTIHLVWPYFIQIQAILTEDHSNYNIEDEYYGTVIEKMKRLGRDFMNSRMMDIKPQQIHKIATVLHPLCKGLPKIDEYERSLVYRDIDLKLQSMLSTQAAEPAAKRVRRDQFNEEFLNDFFGIGKECT